jgi:glycosyltransferase 2 family protein
MLGLAATALAWRTLLAGLGHRLPMLVAATVFFTSQLGKYVPGSVWPYVAQARLGAERGVPGSRAAQAGVTFVLLHLMTGVVIGVPRLLLGAGLDARFGFALLLVPVVLVIVHPAVTARLVALVGRLTKVSVPASSPTWGSMAAASSWLLLAWLLYGMSLAALVAPLQSLTPATFVQLTSAYALAWSVGFVGAAVVVVAAPAGLGFREVALLATLGGVVASGPAALVVVLSRVLMTLADVVWAAGAAAATRARRARQPQSG